jgi:hypothetical protein
MRIPLDTAHKFLGTFGIAKPTKEYERWVHEDGFDMDDFASVLGDSPYNFIIDWRADLVDELGNIANALSLLGAQLDYDENPDTEEITVSCEGRTAQVKYVPADHDDFTNVIFALQSIVPPNIEFRASPGNGDSDTWVFSVLRRDEWNELEALDSEALNNLFVPLPPAS